MKPLLKWAGGKARLAPRIEEAFGVPCRGRHLEPFIGSGAVFLWRRAQGHVGEAILSDVNAKLVALHLATRDDPDGVIEELSRMPTTAGWESEYYRIRDEFNEGPFVGPAHAARFIWLNHAGFNGLYRENRSGGFNVPVGRYTEVHLPDEAEVRQVSRLFQGAEIRLCGFEETMAVACRGDQIYCDPPYVPLTQTAAFTAYSAGGFTMQHQKGLAVAAERAARRGAHVVISNHDLPVVREYLYSASSGFTVVDTPPVSRAISRNVQSRKPVFEVLASIGHPALRVA